MIPVPPGSRMGTTRAQWETAVRKHPELIGLLDGIHFHTLCEQDSSDLETTLTAVKTKFGDLISQMKWLNLEVDIILQDQAMILHGLRSALEQQRKNGR